MTEKGVGFGEGPREAFSVPLPGEGFDGRVTERAEEPHPQPIEAITGDLTADPGSKEAPSVPTPISFDFDRLLGAK